MKYQLYATRKTTRFLRATISLGKWLLIISLTFAAAFIVIWSMYEAWEREEDNRILRQKEKAAMWKIADIKDQNPKHSVRDCVILKGPTRCEAFKGGKRIIVEAK